MKRVLSILLAVLMLMSITPIGAFAEGDVVWKYPTFVVDSREVAPGDIIDVPVSVENNPGIVSFIWQINYEDYAMELLKVTPLQYTSMVVSPLEENPIFVNWCEGERKEDCFDEGEVLLLTFRVKEDAAAGEYPLSLYYDPANVFNTAFESVRFDVHNGWITVRSTECNHEYDYPCAAECYLCGAIREVEHAWYLVKATEPTCSTAGLYRYKCELCGEPYMEQIPPTGQHEYDNDADPDCNNCGEKRDVEECPHKYTVKVLMEATCAKGGLKRYTCVMCGDSYEESTAPTGQHVYDDDIDPDCNNCGEKREVEVHVHEWIEKDSQQPTCTTDGWTKLYCPGCGVMTRETTPAFGHAYDDDFDADCNNCGEKREVEECPHKYTVKVLMAATCAKGGLKRYTCVMCGDSYEESTPSTGQHVYDDDFDADCNNCGEVREVEGECNHEYDNACDSDCNLCGESRVTDGHVYDVTVVDPTCNAAGSTIYVCEICGHKYSTKIPATDHKYKTTWVEARCDAEGYDLHTCTICGDSYKDNFVPARTEHGIVPGEEFFSCTEPGYANYYCMYCDYSYQETWDAPGHSPVDFPTIWDCSRYTYCQRCNEMLKPATGHVYTDLWDQVDPTCEMDGYTRYGCYGCSVYEDVVIPATGHKYDNDFDATCNTCGAVRDVAPCPHKYTVKVLTEATCENGGVKRYTCAMCGDSYEESIPALGHAYDNDADPDCNYCGEKREVQTECQHAYKNADAPVCVVCGEMLSLSDKLTVYGVSDNAQLTRGDTFTLTVGLKNNPGLVGWRVYVGFDESVLELVNQTGGAKWSSTTFGPLQSPANVMFADTIHPDVEGDGTMFTLTFRVREDAAFGTALLDVYVKDPNDFFDRNWSVFEIATVATAVVVSDHTHTYDGVCDGECNVCGFTRDAAEHTYDNACDAACNGCGLVREVKPHPYTVKVVEPTCENEGVKTSVCSICGHTVVESIPALGHDYTVTVFAPDCVNDGYTLHSCNRCRYSYTDAIVPALGHTAGAAADCENAQTCTVCHAVLAPALGHAYNAAVTDPTCTTDGYTTHTCANCGDTYVDSTVAALGHSYDNACDATCNTCGDVREVGDHVYDHDYDPTCNECGEVREIPVLPGDVNDDGTVNVRDYGLLQQYLNGWNVTIVEVAANVNGDSTVNVRDLGLLQQYLNGWDVTLK